MSVVVVAVVVAVVRNTIVDNKLEHVPCSARIVWMEVPSAYLSCDW